MLTLHSHPRSTFSRRVRLQILEKGLQDRVQVQELDMGGRANKQPPYLSLNPYGRVPTLTEGDFALYESGVILGYLEERFPERPLWPSDPEGRALARMHVQLCDLEIGSTTRTLIFPMRFLPQERWNEVEQSQARAQVDRHLKILDRTLCRQPYLLGDDYSLADLAYVPFAEFFELLRVEVPEAVGDWVARILARPASLATRPDR